MNEITVVVEDGMVIEILSSVENSVSVEVLDLDTKIKHEVVFHKDN